MTDTDQALRDAIQQVAKAKVAEALGGDVLGKLVKSVMDHRSSSYGARSDNRTEFERIVENEIEHVIRKAAAEVIAEREAEIRASVRKAFNPDSFAATIIDAFATDDWRASLQVTVKRPSE